PSRRRITSLFAARRRHPATPCSARSHPPLSPQSFVCSQSVRRKHPRRNWSFSMRPLTSELVSTYKHLSTCAVSNAVEQFEIRLRNEGFADGRLRCVFDDLPSVIGHAVTARIRCSTPPPVGHSYIDRTDWWNYLASVPAPRVLVVEDIDDRP